MKIARLFVIVVASVSIGAIGVLCLQFIRTNPAMRSRHSTQIREELLPSQQLTMTDATGNPVGNIYLSDGLIALSLSLTGNGSHLLLDVHSDSSIVYIHFVGNSDIGDTPIMLHPNIVQVSDLKRGYISDTWSNDVAASALDRLRNAFSPPTGRHFDDDMLLPTEDVRFRHKSGWLFASFGLTSVGHPGIAFADEQGTVRIAWFQRKSPNPSTPDWWDIAVFDKPGKMRVSVQLRPGEPPDVVFFTNDLGLPHVLDFASHKLVPRDAGHPSSFSWFPAMQVRPRSPIRITDIRDRLLWRAP
jgi:hypothetical protein